MKALIMTGLAVGMMTASAFAHGGFRVAIGCGPGVVYAPPPPMFMPAPVYVQRPVYVAPPPVVYAPAPIMVAAPVYAPPVCVVPPPPVVVYAPPTVVYRPCRPHFSIRIGF